MQADQQTKLSFCRRTLLIVGLVWALIVIVPDLSRLVYPLGMFGFTADNDGLIIAVDDDGAAARTKLRWLDRPLRSGDRIDLSGAPCFHLLSADCRSLIAVFGGNGGLTYVLPGTKVSLPIIGQENEDVGGGENDVSGQLELAASPPDSESWVEHWLWWIMLLGDEIAGILVVVESFRLVWTWPCRMTMGFFLFAMWFNPGQYFTWYALLQNWPPGMLAQELFQALATGAGYAGFMIFGLRFPHNRTEPELRWAEPVGWGIGSVLAVLQLCSFMNVFGYQTETITRAAMLGGYAVDFAVLPIVVYRRRSQSPQDLQRLRWVIWGCVIGLPTFILADSYEATTLWTKYVFSNPTMAPHAPSEWLLEFLYLLSGLLTYAICSAIRRPRVVNVGRPVLQISRWLFVIMWAAVAERLCELLLLWLMDMIRGASDEESVIPWGATVVLLLIAVATGDRVAKFVENYIERDRHHAFAGLGHARRKMRGSTDAAQIDRLLIEEPVRHLKLTSAALFRKDGRVYRRQDPAPGWGVDEATTLSADDCTTLLATLGSGRVPSAAASSRRFDSFPAGLGKPAMAVAVAVAEGSNRWGIVFYGPHETGDDLDPEEREQLELVGSDAASGYDHVEVAMRQLAEPTMHLAV